MQNNWLEIDSAYHDAARLQCNCHTHDGDYPCPQCDAFIAARAKLKPALRTPAQAGISEDVRLDNIMNCLGFFASVIKSGERWTPTCQQAHENAIADAMAYRAIAHLFPAGSMGEDGCEDCGRQYGSEHGFPDLIIPYSAWKEISPSKDDGGLLCPSCICKRLHDAKIECVGSFMSGPIRSIDSAAMENLRRVENIELGIEGRQNKWGSLLAAQQNTTPKPRLRTIAPECTCHDPRVYCPMHGASVESVIDDDDDLNQNTAYGTGPAMAVLPEVRADNEKKKRELQNTAGVEGDAAIRKDAASISTSPDQPSAEEDH